MGKDWVVWLVCVLLFCAGAIWGGVPISTNFFVIESLHDLSETVGGFATVAALIAAVIGINAWKREVRATADHELARRLAVGLSKYKDASVLSWTIASVAIGDVGDTGKNEPADLSEHYDRFVRDELNAIELTRSEINSLATECVAIWGESLDVKFKELFKFEEFCTNCSRQYLRWRSTNSILHKNVMVNLISKAAEKFEILEIENRDDAKKYVNKISASVDAVLKEKLLS